MSSRALALRLVLAAGLSGIAAPLFADETVMDAEGRVFGDTVEDPLPEWKSPAMHQGAPRMLPPMPMAASMAPGGYPGPDLAAWEEQRADWLAECRQRFGGKGQTAGGVVGGLIGGVAGSAIAGRGNRTVGAVVGGLAGAVAGSAVGASSDRRRARDYCESYLDRYTASYGQGYPQAQGPSYPPGYGPGYSYGYGTGYGHAYGVNYGYPQPQPHPQMIYGYAAQPMMMVPVMMTTVATPVTRQQDCVETEIVEEWVTVSRPARRVIHRRAVPDKRVRLVPDKRIRTH